MEKVIEILEKIKTIIDKWIPIGIDEAIALLKKQEPKAIVKKWHKNPLGDYSRVHCPWCDRELDMQSVKEYVACPYCGRPVKLE